MKATAIVMAGLCVIAALAVASPAMAEEGEGDTGRTCVKIYEKPPDVIVDIGCILALIEDLIDPHV